MSMFVPLDFMACCRTRPAETSPEFQEELVIDAIKEVATVAIPDLRDRLVLAEASPKASPAHARSPASSPAKAADKLRRGPTFSPGSSPTGGASDLPMLLGRGADAVAAEADMVARFGRLGSVEEAPPERRPGGLLRRRQSSRFSGSERAAHNSEGDAPDHTQRRRFGRMRSASRESGMRMSGFMRTLTRRLSSVFHLTPERPECLVGLARAAPPPASTKPSSIGRLSAASASVVREAILSEGQPLFRRFAAEALGAYDFTATQWYVDPDVTCMQMTYLMPTPKDVPEFAKKMVSMPPCIGNKAVVWFSVDDTFEHVTLKQRCYSEGVMYSDHFYIEVTVDIAPDSEGGVVARQWVEVVWTKALPWSMSLVASFINKRVKEDSVSKFPMLLRILTELTTAA